MESWSRSEIISVISVAVAILSCAVTVIIPEIRRLLGLEDHRKAQQMPHLPNIQTVQPALNRQAPPNSFLFFLAKVSSGVVIGASLGTLLGLLTYKFAFKEGLVSESAYYYAEYSKHAMSEATSIGGIVGGIGGGVIGVIFGIVGRDRGRVARIIIGLATLAITCWILILVNTKSGSAYEYGFTGGLITSAAIGIMASIINLLKGWAS